MLFEELYNSVISRHLGGAGHAMEKERNEIRARRRELLKADSLKSRADLSAGGWHERNVNEGLPRRSSAHLPGR